MASAFGATLVFVVRRPADCLVIQLRLGSDGHRDEARNSRAVDGAPIPSLA